MIPAHFAASSLCQRKSFARQHLHQGSGGDIDQEGPEDPSYLVNEKQIVHTVCFIDLGKLNQLKTSLLGSKSVKQIVDVRIT